MARNLSAKKSNTIGLVLPKISQFFLISVIERIYKIAYENKYEIILLISHEDDDIERKNIKTLLAMKVDGIIICLTDKTKNYEVFNNVKRRGVHTIFIDRIPKLDKINSVEINYKNAISKAIDYAVKNGFKNFGYFSASVTTIFGHESIIGFNEAIKKHKLFVYHDWVVEGGLTEKFGYDEFNKLNESKNLPQVIITANYQVALGVYIAATEKKIRIPGDLEIITFCYNKNEKYNSFPFCFIDIPTEDIIDITMEQIFKNINERGKIEYNKIVVEPELTDYKVNK
ncbi:MAG: LacI family DNA-binding transcriptional regulator [Ignavibacteriaceae bacterium]|jgi:LacI family transcriptional regulator|nr:LacI family DNA-binding transcriptional regulator [Ignavibacteriaceae bacterium]